MSKATRGYSKSKSKSKSTRKQYMTGCGKTYVVRRILAHKVDPDGRKTMLYKIRWAKYGPSHDSWEPEESLCTAATCLDEYWRNRRLRFRIRRLASSSSAWALEFMGKGTDMRAVRIGAYQDVVEAAMAHDRAAMFLWGVQGRHGEWMFPDEQPCIPSTEEILALESCDLSE